METTKRLGKRLKVGETFITTTKWMYKNRHSNSKWNADLSGPLVTYEVFKTGSIRSFNKGSRRYLCVIVGLVETKCKRSIPYFYENFQASGKIKIVYGTAWWQFSYLVKIIEN